MHHIIKRCAQSNDTALSIADYATLDAEFFASNGVDAIKHDNCVDVANTTEGIAANTARYAALGAALNKTGRPILYDVVLQVAHARTAPSYDDGYIWSPEVYGKEIVRNMAHMWWSLPVNKYNCWSCCVGNSEKIIPDTPACSSITGYACVCTRICVCASVCVCVCVYVCDCLCVAIVVAVAVDSTGPTHAIYFLCGLYTTYIDLLHNMITLAWRLPFSLSLSPAVCADRVHLQYDLCCCCCCGVFAGMHADAVCFRCLTRKTWAMHPSQASPRKATGITEVLEDGIIWTSLLPASASRGMVSSAKLNRKTLPHRHVSVV